METLLQEIIGWSSFLGCRPQRGEGRAGLGGGELDEWLGARVLRSRVFRRGEPRGN